MVLLLGFRVASADRKRVVILPLEGDEKAEKIHAALVKLVKKSHTVVSTEKWETTAEEMSASKISDANIKKVAKKLKVDGVIEGTVTKRRDEYVIKLKLHAGTTGAVANKVDTKAEDTKLTGASKDIKDELISAIDDLKSVRGEDDDEKPKKAKKGEDEDEKPKKAKKGEDEDEKPKKAKKGEDEDEKPKKAKKGEDEDDKKPSKFGTAAKMEKGGDAKGKKGEDEDAKPKKAKKGEDEDEKPKKAAKGSEADEDENPNPKPKKGKEVAKKGGDGEEDGGEVRGGGDVGTKLGAAEAILPGNRAIDAAFGASFNTRRLAWKADGDLATGTPGTGRPPNYNGVPAPGAAVDITAYPMAFGHKGGGQAKNIGITAMFDRALLISSKLGDGTKLKTAASHYAFGATYRYPVSPTFVVGGQLTYGRQSFQIGQANGMSADIPNVNYTAIEPGAFMRLGVGKMVLGFDLGYQLISNTGQMTKNEFYGKATVGGLDVGLALDYPLTKALFARGGLNIDRISYKFNGTGTQTNRDADPEPDVQGATDLYFGITAAIGYVY